MQVTCHFQTYKEDDAHDGDIDAEVQTETIRCAPSDFCGALYDLIPRMEPEGPMEWSSWPQHGEGDWLSLSGRLCDYRPGSDQCFRLSLVGPVAHLRRALAQWSK